ncbi:CLUMA_CG018727, isoform A [Clunio marinus]|uniref:Single-pass membrane and coiled-coil domain-containing protein 4 homolog n=1 Tax=Clunio marinus TaxID=568069 RepID=A0A1J1IZX3_9DIPT|nr:CLUMA_CG018727, isoform A [Clunio marinus]
MARNRVNNEKLSRKEKQEMRKESAKMNEQIKTIVLPTLGVVFLLIWAFVYMKTRGIPITIPPPEDD